LSSSSALFVQAVAIFAEQALECRTSCNTCSETEDSGRSLGSCNGLPDAVVRVTEEDAVGLSENSVGELEYAAVYFLETLTSLD
jgi:hypothetical protein